MSWLTVGVVLFLIAYAVAIHYFMPWILERMGP